jgi:hypothetical protein
LPADFSSFHQWIKQQMRRSTAHLKLQMASLPAPKSICSRSTKKQLDNNKKISFKIFILSTAPNRNPKRFRGAKKKMLIGPLGPYFYSPFSLKSKTFPPQPPLNFRSDNFQ